LRAIGDDPALCLTMVELYARAVDDLAHFRRVWVAEGRLTVTLSEQY
jgi:hypothetical protein